MTTKTFLQIIKSFNISEIKKYYIGRLDSKYNYELLVKPSVYNHQDIAIGGKDLTEIFTNDFEVFYKGDDNFDTTETTAQKIYDALFNSIGSIVTINNVNYKINYIKFGNNMPVNFGSNEDGTFTSLIKLTLYYTIL